MFGMEAWIDPNKEKIEEINRFERRILIATDCLSEGINLQDGFNSLIHYDLPWNPMRVEQRIGRLDRFGQLADKIFILNIRIPGTIEDDIFMRLFNRIGVFEDSIGELEPILRVLGYIDNSSLGRSLTNKGKQYLEEFDGVLKVA